MTKLDVILKWLSLGFVLLSLITLFAGQPTDRAIYYVLVAIFFYLVSEG